MGTSLVSPTILDCKLTMKRSYVARTPMLYGLFKADMCALRVLNTPSCEKVALSLSSMESGKVNFCNTLVNKPLCKRYASGGDHLSAITALYVHEMKVRLHHGVYGGELLEILRFTMTSVQTLIPEVLSTACNIFPSNMSVRDVRGHPVSSKRH